MHYVRLIIVTIMLITFQLQLNAVKRNLSKLEDYIYLKVPSDNQEYIQ